MSIFNTNTLKKTSEKDLTLFLPYRHLALFDRTFKATAERQGVVCVVLCATVLEAFINDIVNVYTWFSKNPARFFDEDRPVNNYLNEVERKMLDDLVKAERNNLFEKFSILGEWDNSEKTYQEFKELVRIRNNIVHPKPEKIELCRKSGKIDGYPKFLNNFFQKSIIQKPEKMTSWIEILEEREFCLWCQDVTYRVIQKATAMLPDSNIKQHFEQTAYFTYKRN